MIATFPEFTPIAEVTLSEFQQACAGFPPYSEFNHLSLRCYTPEASVACYDNALILRGFEKQLSLTVLGYALKAEPLFALVDYAASLGCERKLNCVPAFSLHPDVRLAFAVAERRERFDYVLALDSMLNPESSQLRRKHKRALSYQETHLDLVFSSVAIAECHDTALLLEVFMAWRQRKGGEAAWLAEEELVFRRCLEFAHGYPLIAVLARDKSGAVLGFTINELLPDGFYMGHFGFTVPGQSGLSDLLELETAKVMAVHGCTRMNFQEDLGIEGLRNLKLSWQPQFLLHKYDLKPYR